jgi:hypothetical protein
VIRSVLLLAAVALISGCGGLAPPLTEAQREARRQEDWQKRYNTRAREECRQTPDVDERRACLDRVGENSVMRGAPLRS